jgi:beta-lactamase class A
MLRPYAVTPGAATGGLNAYDHLKGPGTGEGAFEMVFYPGVMKWALVAVAIAALAGGCFRAAPYGRPRNPERDRRLAALERDLSARLAAIPGTAALWFKDLDTGDVLALGGDRVFHAASVMKVFVLLEVHKRAYEGTLSLDDEVELADAFPGAVDGKPFGVDDCAALREKAGGRATLRRLCEEMIAVSSNCATNNLLQRLGGPDAVTQTAHATGATRTRIPRYIEDAAAFRAGLNQETTAADVGGVLERIALRQLVSAESSLAMRQTLTLCEGGFLGRDLPAEEVEIAHKDGLIEGLRHDAGIIAAPRGTYVLVILMQDLRDERAGEDAGAALSKAVYDYIRERPR